MSLEFVSLSKIGILSNFREGSISKFQTNSLKREGRLLKVNPIFHLELETKMKKEPQSYLPKS
jgi:hypothetical protein